MTLHMLDDKPEITKQNFLILDTLVVRPRYQRVGVGSAVIKYAARFANRNGLWLLAQVPESSRMKRFLHIVGFRAIGGVSIDRAESFRSAAGRDVYLTMAYNSKVAPASIAEPKSSLG